MGRWYKEWYLANAVGEAQIRAALSDPDNSAENLADIKKRLDEFRQIPEDRCSISRDQRLFIERILGSIGAE